MSQSKIYFGAGPAALPRDVIEQTAAAVLDYEGTGISLLSIPHRDSLFQRIMDESRELVFQLSGLDPDDYEVLWLQGGGRQQFAMVPMNFLPEAGRAGYIDSGHWAYDAISNAGYYGMAEVLGSTRDINYTRLPDWPTHFPPDLHYLHLTTNNTIYGTQWPRMQGCPVPLIADMSSDMFSMQRDYSRFDLIYAVAQKNLGPAGVTLVIVSKDMLNRSVRELPEAFSYKAQAAAGSMLNTPPVAAIYSCLLVLRWIAGRGMERVEADNRQKAATLYEEIERNPLFSCPVEPESRSLMNVIFRMTDTNQEAAFLAFAAGRNIEGIKGHRSVGGFRASIYNAISIEDVAELVSAMRAFEPGLA